MLGVCATSRSRSSTSSKRPVQPSPDRPFTECLFVRWRTKVFVDLGKLPARSHRRKRGMSYPSQSYTRNLLLSSMGPADFSLLQPHLERVELQRNDFLFQADKPIENLYFLESGVASIVSSEANGD